MYDQILVPYDGSDGATAVLGHAGDIAQHLDAAVRLLFVADTNRSSVTRVDDEVVDGLVRSGQEILDDASQVFDNRESAVETVVEQGEPVETILDYARQHPIDLMVLPTHGRTGIPRYLLGSVSEKVLRLSPVPVLTARMQPDERLHFPYERLLLPTDGSATALEAAHHGLSLADTLDAAVHVLSVVEELSPEVDVQRLSADGDHTGRAGEAVEEIASAAAEYEIAEITTAVREANPAEAILDEIDATASDAVVMGTRGRRDLERILLGSVAEKTVRTATVPVVTVRSAD